MIAKIWFPLLAVVSLAFAVLGAIDMLSRGINFHNITAALAIAIVSVSVAAFLGCRGLQLWMPQREWLRGWTNLPGTAKVFAVLLTIVGVLGLSSEAWRLIRNSIEEPYEVRARATLNDERLDYPSLPLQPPDPYAWSFQSLDGAEVSLADFRGKVLFINRWATWCGPCRVEMPSMQNLYDEFKDDDRIAFVFVSGEDLETIQGFADENGYTFPMYGAAGEDTPRPLQSGGIPYTVILTRDGQVAYSHTGYAKWDTEKTKDFLRALAASAKLEGQLPAGAA